MTWRRAFNADLAKHTIPVNFGNAAEFLGYDLWMSQVKPGEQVEIVTLWQVNQPVTDAVLFTHVRGSDGIPIAQADQLNVPGHNWYSGDLFIQLHELEIPADSNPGEYSIAIGLCQQTTLECQRLPIIGDNGTDLLNLTTLSVKE